MKTQSGITSTDGSQIGITSAGCTSMFGTRISQFAKVISSTLLIEKSPVNMMKVWSFCDRSKQNSAGTNRFPTASTGWLIFLQLGQVTS